MSDSALTSSPSLVSSSSGLAVAHGPGVLLSHHSGPYPFLVDGCSFVKYHQQPSLFNHSGKRLMFYQHNFLFWLKPGVGRPRPGEEHTVDQQYQAPLTHIQAVRSGKHEPCFTQCKQAIAVPEERAWSLLIRRGDGKEEHVDFEASSAEERDKWVAALQALTATARQTETDRDGGVRVVDVAYKVDERGQVAVTVAPAAAPAHSTPASATSSTSSSTSSTTAAAPPTTAVSLLTVLTGLVRSHKGEDDTPSPYPAGSQRSTATSTSGLADGSSASHDSSATDAKLAAALQENKVLKERIAELEERLKGTQVDSVSAS